MYFACVPPDIAYNDLWQLFSLCGQVVDINLYKPFAKARLSKVRAVLARVAWGSPTCKRDLMRQSGAASSTCKGSTCSSPQLSG